MGNKKSMPIYHHEYYGPLINSYSKCIFSSGLLLDEDLEVFLREYSFKTYSKKKKYKPSYTLGIGVALALLSLYVFRKFDSRLLLLPSTLVIAVTGVIEIDSINHKRHHNVLIDNLVDAMKKNHTLNGSIVRYMKTREELGRNSDKHLFVQFNKNIKEFLKLMAKCEFSFFQVILNNLERIAKYSNDLLQDFESLKNFDSITIIKESDVTDIVESLAFVKIIQDVHIWINSKLLSYLGIIFCSETSNIDINNFDLFINKHIPHMLSCFQHHHDYLKKQFSYLKSSTSKLSEYKTKTIVPPKIKISAKLRDSLLFSIDNISILLEKGQELLEEIENNENNCSITIIDTALLDLRDHTHAIFESLDLLCKLYGILTNSDKKTNCVGATSPKPVNNMEGIPLMVNHDDLVEPQEENFELYIDKNNSNENIEIKENYCEDESRVYLNLMLRELNDSLQKHDKFIKAKHNTCDEVKNVSEIITHQDSLPKFDLSLVNKGPEIILPKNFLESDSSTEMKLPPLPPALPSIELYHSISGSSSQNSNDISMFEQIRALSSQRNVEEEILSISSSIE